MIIRTDANRVSPTAPPLYVDVCCRLIVVPSLARTSGRAAESLSLPASGTVALLSSPSRDETGTFGSIAGSMRASGGEDGVGEHSPRLHSRVDPVQDEYAGEHPGVVALGRDLAGGDVAQLHRPVVGRRGDRLAPRSPVDGKLKSPLRLALDGMGDEGDGST
jgi:hypothetical protein